MDKQADKMKDEGTFLLLDFRFGTKNYFFILPNFCVRRRIGCFYKIFTFQRHQ